QTVLLSSHLLGEVQQICDRVGVISEGRLLTESTVAELRGQATGLLVRAEPQTAASDVAARLLGAEQVTATDGALWLSTSANSAPALTQALVEAGVAVSEIRPVERTLEEAFFEMTGTELTSDKEEK